MVVDDVKRRYSKGAMLFHWVIAALVIYNWWIAEQAGDLEGPARGALMGTHKAIGITILVLTLGRIAWRLTHRLPPLPSNYGGWEKVLARGTHLVFYVLLVAMPLGGWAASSLSERPVDYFGLFTVPMLPLGQNEGLAESIYGLHELGGKAMLILVVLHVLGALKHTFVDKDGGIFRMLPFGKVRGEG